MKSKKKKSSPKFPPILSTTPRRNAQNIPFVWSNLMPNLQRGAMPQFCLLFYAILQSWRPEGGGGQGTMAPLKYAPGSKSPRGRHWPWGRPRGHIFKFLALTSKPTTKRWSPRGRPWPRAHVLKSLALASKPKLFFFISANIVLPVQAVQTAKHLSKTIQSHSKESGARTNHFELLMLKHGGAYSAYEFRRKYGCDNEM